MSAPMVPPRPQQRPQASVKQDAPQIPPRPTRKTDPSPDREAYTRSPLNSPATVNGNGGLRAPSKLSEASRRPPSISLPQDVGEEGLEYTSYDQLPQEAHAAPSEATAPSEQTRNVAAELPMHAPKASLPKAAAQSRIATVTRTDSTQAAAAGIGKAKPEDDVHTASDAGAPLSRVTSRTYDDNLRRVASAEPHPLRSKSSFNRSSSSLQGGSPRPPSIHGVEYHEGIPMIGQQIPLYKNAGDVQAPSPAPTQSQHTPGIGFFNDGSVRAHHRKRSSRHEFGPPDSYGLHGHGQSYEGQDRFERDWQKKHPEEAAKEGYSMYMHRPETALSSEQLNRLVQENTDIGMGTSPNAIGTPSQDIAFEASEQFASRFNSPKASPLPLSDVKKRSSSGSHQISADSPLKRQSFPFGENDRLHPDPAATDSEDPVIHVNPPHRRGDKITGGGAMDDTLDLGPTGGNTEERGGWYDERGEGIPILASDETMKRPGSAFLQPAVGPEDSKHIDDDYYYDSDHLPPSRKGSAQPTSRPSSRPSSMHGYHGGSLHRFVSHEEHDRSGMGTPLEEIEEYEPLFPEDENEKPMPFKKRPGLAQHHFPSQDIWEDTPSSLQYQTYVDTPEPPAEKIAAANGNPAAVFETPEQEQRRKEGNDADMTTDGKTFAKPHFKSGVLEDMHMDRPGVQRFPSRDIWEDTPDSMRLVTTVSSPQMDETKSPPEERPTTAALPLNQDEADARSTTGMTQVMRPNVPARPERKSKLAQEITHDVPQNEDPRQREVPDLGSNEEQIPDRTKPTIPGRPKPTVPARPARTSHSDQMDGSGAPLAKTASAGSGASSDTVTSPPAQKAKPAVPARPAGSKIAALQAGFMNDLNNRLKLGPQGPPPRVHEAEPEAEAAAETTKEPLADARKGRAKGPARRKPAASPAPPAVDHGFSFSSPLTLWHIDENDELNVPSTEPPAEKSVELELEKQLSANEASNTQEPSMHTRSQSISEPSATDAKASVSAQEPSATGAHGDVPPPSISPAVAEEAIDIQPGLEQSLANAEPAPRSAEEVERKQVVHMADSVAQTGQQDARITSSEGDESRLTASIGGPTSTEGDVAVKDGE